jgi:hypothetical protein
MASCKPVVAPQLHPVAAPDRYVRRHGGESRTDRHPNGRGQLVLAWEKKAGALARRAEGRTGDGQLTDAVGEGLAAVAYAVLRGGFTAQRPRVWLDTRSSAGAWVRGEDIVSARVRDAEDNGGGRFVLEVFVPGLPTVDRWLTVATGASEWFELNAAEQLLTLLEETARSEDDEPAAVFVTITGEADDKQGLAVDRNY